MYKHISVLLLTLFFVIGCGGGSETTHNINLPEVKSTEDDPPPSEPEPMPDQKSMETPDGIDSVSPPVDILPPPPLVTPQPLMEVHTEPEYDVVVSFNDGNEEETSWFDRLKGVLIPDAKATVSYHNTVTEGGVFRVRIEFDLADGVILPVNSGCKVGVHDTHQGYNPNEDDIWMRQSYENGVTHVFTVEHDDVAEVNRKVNLTIKECDFGDLIYKIEDNLLVVAVRTAGIPLIDDTVYTASLEGLHIEETDQYSTRDIRLVAKIKLTETPFLRTTVKWCVQDTWSKYGSKNREEVNAYFAEIDELFVSDEEAYNEAIQHRFYEGYTNHCLGDDSNGYYSFGPDSFLYDSDTKTLTVGVYNGYHADDDVTRTFKLILDGYVKQPVFVGGDQIYAIPSGGTYNINQSRKTLSFTVTGGSEIGEEVTQ